MFRLNQFLLHPLTLITGKCAFIYVVTAVRFELTEGVVKYQINSSSTDYGIWLLYI